MITQNPFAGQLVLSKMTTMFINGCSYAHAWGESSIEFGKSLGYDNVVNLGLSGGSNDRIFRTSTQYILENKVDFAIIMLTFYSRNESAWANSIPAEGPWLSYSDPESIEFFSKRLERHLRYNLQDLKEFAKLNLLVDSAKGALCERLLATIVTFSSLMEAKKIPYLIFGSCDMQYDDVEVPRCYVNEISKNKRIIDIFNWSSNKLLIESGSQGFPYEQHLSPILRHHFARDHQPLNNFLANYINSNDLKTI